MRTGPVSELQSNFKDTVAVYTNTWLRKKRRSAGTQNLHRDQN